MITVPEAARRSGRDPETIRRWIRQGKLRSEKIGTQHLVDEGELDSLVVVGTLPLPRGWWRRTHTGEAMPDVTAALRRFRRGH